jgi:hypothetical protein
VTELSELKTQLDEMAKGIAAVSQGWSLRFGTIEREITQQHRWQQDHQLDADAATKSRTVNTRVWIALIALISTVANGAIQVINVNGRSSLREEVISDLKSDNAELIKKAAQAAVEVSDRRFELQVKATK